MTLAGTMTIFRWSGGAHPPRESLVFGKDLLTVLELPSGADQETGHNQAEGLTLFDPDGGEAGQVLIVHYSAARSWQRGISTVEADFFVLP